MSILFTDFIHNVIKKSKMNFQDALMISDKYDRHKPLIVCRIVMNQFVPGGKTTILRFRYDKSTHYLVDYAFEDLSPSFTEIENYMHSIKEEPIPIVDDIDTLVPSNMTAYKTPDTTIVISIDNKSESGLKIALSNRHGSHAKPVPPPRPFDHLIHTKPPQNADVGKSLARRLIADGFRLLHKTHLINGKQVHRLYVYRNIHIAFYKDVCMFVGIVYPPESNMETMWREFPIRPDILDTEVFDFLNEYWYHVGFVHPSHEFEHFIRHYPEHCHHNHGHRPPHPPVNRPYPDYGRPNGGHRPPPPHYPEPEVPDETFVPYNNEYDEYTESPYYE